MKYVMYLEIHRSIVKTTQAPAAIETGSQSRAKVLINRVDPDSGERKDHLPSEASTVGTQVEEKHYAFILRKIVRENELKNEGEIEITSQFLWSLLKRLLSHYPYHLFRGSPTIIRSPYEPFIMNWEKLEQAAKEVPKDETDKQCRSDLGLLLLSIRSGSGDLKLDKYFKTRAANIERSTVTFESLWTIFPPGSLIYGKPFLGEDAVLVVQDNTGTWPSQSEDQDWSLLCWIYDWGGKSFKRLCLEVTFQSFDGQKPITALPYYPLELVKDRDTLTAKLVERGREFRQYCLLKQGQRMFSYSGEAIFDKKGFSGVQIDDEKVSLPDIFEKIS